MSGPTTWTDVAGQFAGDVLGLVLIALLVVTCIHWAFGVGSPDQLDGPDE